MLNKDREDENVICIPKVLTPWTVIKFTDLSTTINEIMCYILKEA